MSDKYIINAAYQKLGLEGKVSEPTSTSSTLHSTFELGANSCRFEFKTTRDALTDRVCARFQWLSKKQKPMQVTDGVFRHF